MKSDKPRQSLQRLVIRWGVPMALLVAAGSPPGKTQITSLSASDPDTLGTLVNGSEGGSCSSNICAITGGTAKDNKLFHRLSEFWAHSGISKVTIDNDQSSNNPYQSVILSNIDSYGTYIDTSVEFTTSKSDLVILSPGGISIGPGAAFSNIGSIALSTSDQLRIGEQTFHFLDSSASDIDSFSDAIELIQNNFLNEYSDGGEISITIKASEHLTIDGDLLLHGIGGVYLDSDNDGTRGTLNVTNSLDIQSKGNSIEYDPEIEATTLYDVDIQAKSVKIDSTGSGVQPQALWIKNSQIKSTDGDINLKGISGDEITGGEDDVRGIVIEAQSSLIADTGNIILQGEAGDGDGQTVTETYTWEENGSTYTASETFDVAVGRGIEINQSTIDAKAGTIDIDAVASNGSIVFYGHGADLRNSKLEADKIEINGTSAKSTSDTKYSHGISLDTTTLLGVSGIDLVGQSGHQEANGPDGEQVSGIKIYDSELTNSSGPLTMTGTGGSGTILDDSEGINIESSTIRAAAIDLNGTGGKAADPNLSDRSLGIRIRQSTLDSSSTSLTLTSEANGNIVLKGTGGSGQDDLSGVSIIDTSTVDSAGSIEITGKGGSGDTLKYVNGVFIRGDDSADTPTYTKLKANKKITINGEGGVGTKNDQSSGVKIEYAEIESDELVEIEGVGGTSTSTSTEAENRTGWVDGVIIWDSTVTVNASDAEITTTNPYGATLRVDGSAGRADGYVKDGSGILIEDSTLSTTGVLHLDGDGGSSSSKISEYSNGIYALNGTIEASSVQIKGTGGSSTSLDALNAEGQRIDQISRGVFLNNTSIKAATGSTNHDGAITINGKANKGNTDLTGIELDNSTTLDAETSINLVGEGGSANTDSNWAAGIRLYAADLDAGTTISLTGTGGKGIGTSNLLNASDGVTVDQSTISQTGEQGSVIIKGIAGTSDGELRDANGVLLYNSTVDTQGTLEIDGTGGTALSATNVRGVFLDETNITTSAALKLKGEGGVATTSSTESAGIDLYNADLTALSIEMDGSGGTAAKSSTQSTDLFGIFIEKSRISTTAGNINAGNITLKGSGGVGYRYLNGVMIENSTIETDQDIIIEGTAGSGEKVEFANGVAIQSYTDYDEEGNPIAESSTSTSTLKAANLSITGDGGKAEISATEAQGIVLENSNLNLTGSINLQGTGGSGSSVTSEEKAEFNNGLFLRENTIKTGADFKITGTAGTGGDFVIGSLHEKNTYDIKGNASIKGTGGKGQDVRDSFGVGIDRDTWLVSGTFTVDGEGGDGVTTKNAYGAAMRLSKVTANAIDVSGTGGDSTDTQNSRENYGTALQFSTIKSIGGNISISGKGGTGGEDDTGIVLASVNLNSAQDINIEGEGGAGDIVKFSRGIGLYSESASNFNDDDDIENVDNLPVSLTEFDSTEYEGTTWYENSINAVNVSLKGKGGTAENKNESGSNQGVFIEDSNFNLTGDLEVDGRGGIGGSLVTGVETVYSDFTINGNVLIKGNGGSGDIIRFAEGILIWNSDFNVSGKQIQLEGRGGSGSKIRDGIGIELDTTDIVSLNSDATIQLNGFGGVATNKIDSQDNTGIKLSNTDIIGGQYQNIIGIGGNGGKKNNGLLVRNTDLITESGDLTLSGTGGEGINIQKGSGIVIDTDLSTENSSEQPDPSTQTTSAAINSTELKARTIKLEGNGGTSVLTKNAINEQGVDTFNQTAENRGIRIQNAKLTAQSGYISLTGNGGKLLADQISNPDADSEVVAISQASDLEGISLKDVTSLATQWTYIGGQAGQPVAGNKNSGTTIISSTINTATTIPTTSSGSTVSGKAKARSINPAQENRIEGNAFSGTNDNYGLTIDNTTIESKYDSLTLAGRGGLKATGEKNYGIYIRNGSSVVVGSMGHSHDLNIYGAGGDGTDMTGGILTENTSYRGFGKINMVGESLGGSGELSAAISIFNKTSIQSTSDTNVSGNNDVNVSDSSVDTGGDLNLNAEEDLNLNQTTISTDQDLNAAAGNDVNIDNSEIDSEGDVNTTAGNDVNIDNSEIDSEGDVNTTAGNDVNIDNSEIDTEGDVNATAGNDITVADSEIESNSITLEADTVEIDDTSLSADQNLEIIAISGLDITSSELDASDAVALNSYSIAIESSTVTTTDLTVNSTQLTQEGNDFGANSFSIGNEQNSDDNSSGALQSLGLDVNSSLQSAGSQANNSAPTQSNSELTMSLAGGVNYILDDSAQDSSSNDSQTSTTTSSSETNSATSASTGSDEDSSGDNDSVNRDASSESESESEQAESGDDEQEGKEDADSSEDQKTTKGSGNNLPTQKLTAKQTKQIHQESEAQSSKFVASQLGLPERPAMTIQEIQGMLTSGMASMNKSSQ